MSREHLSHDEIYALDISSSADLRVLAEEVARTRRPKSLRSGDVEIARIVPSAKARKPRKIDPAQLTAALERLGEAMGDTDPEELIADIYRAREEGSRPANRP